MDSTEKHTGAKTPAKTPQKSRSKTQLNSSFTENRNPNVSSSSSPLIRSAKKPVSENPNPNASSLSLSPAMKSAKKTVLENPNPRVSSSSSSPAVKSAKKSVSKDIKSDSPNVVMPGKNKIRERRFVVVKKNSKKKNSSTNVACKCKEKSEINGDKGKCVCSAYEILRASQEEFFKRKDEGDDQVAEIERLNEGEEKMENPRVKDLEIGEEDDKFPLYESNHNDSEEIKVMIKTGDSIIKKEKVMGLARQSVTQLGSGNVKNLVKAFERILSVPLSSPNVSEGKDEGQSDEIVIDANNASKVMKWAMPGLNLEVPESEESLSFENLGLMDALVSSSWDSSHESISSRTSSGGRKNRRNSTESTGTKGGTRFKKKQLRITSQKPFKLRTEVRGRLKEEDLVKKIQKMMEEQEKQRIPVAQGLPWTTDEPECLVKPPVKDITRPVDLMLHSDIRAVERAEFDHQVAKKLSFIEQYKLEKELQQKLEEEEETRRLRKELIPKAQPMPYFDRPFIPIRSMKNPTVPKTPKFNIPEHKKSRCNAPLDDMNPYTLYE